jgi:hypothetical protein
VIAIVYHKSTSTTPPQSPQPPRSKTEEANIIVNRKDVTGQRYPVVNPSGGASVQDTSSRPTDSDSTRSKRQKDDDNQSNIEKASSDTAFKEAIILEPP